MIGLRKGNDTPSRATPPSRYAHLRLPTLYNYGSLDATTDLLSAAGTYHLQETFLVKFYVELTELQLEIVLLFGLAID